MPRDANGNYTLPAGNPVVTQTLITSVWANSTMNDVAAALTDSLDRTGKGGATAAMRFADGTDSAPGITFNNDVSLGFYRDSGSGQMRIAKDLGIQAPNTTVFRPIQDHLGIFVTPEMWGATGDGVAVDTAAVSSAIADGRAIWCEKTYLIDANITGFHSARWMGPGSIKFGTSTWPVAPYSPSTDRTIHVSASGSTSNMGLDPTNSVTPQKAADIINEYPDYLPGGFVVQFAAGTYTTGIIFTPTTRFEDAGRLNARRIKLAGPVTGGATPTVIFDNVTGASGGVVRLFGRMLVTVSDIRFTNCASLRGIDAQNQVILDCRNVWVDNCSGGINTNIQCRLWVRGGEFKNITNNGIECVAGTVYTIIKDDQAAGKVPLISACQNGVRLAEVSTGHIDDAIIQDCTQAGVSTSRFSRALFDDNVTIQRNFIGARFYSAVEDDTAPVDFKTGTVDANGVDVFYYGHSYDVATSSLAPSTLTRISEGLNANHTGVTARTLVWDSSSNTPNRLANRSQLWSIPGGRLVRLGQSLALHWEALITGTAGLKTLEIDIGGTVIATATTSAAGGFVLDVTFAHRWNDQANNQNVTMSFKLNGVSPVVTQQMTSLTMTAAAAKAIQIYVTLANAADRVDMGNVEVTCKGF